MFRRAGRAIARHPRSVVGAWVVAAVLAASLALGGWGTGGLFERLSTGGIDTPGTDSARVSTLTGTTAESGGPITVVVRGLDVAGDPAGAAAALTTARAQLQGVDGVEAVTDAFTMPDPTSLQAQALLSARGDGAVVLVTLGDDLTDAQADAATARVQAAATGGYQDALRVHAPHAQVDPVSTAIIGDAITDLVRQDLTTGESVSLPVALVLLVLVFGGLLAAGLPLIGALATIVTGMGALWVMSWVMDLHSFILNVITLIGLSLSVDYGLLVVSRYREEVAAALADGAASTDIDALVRGCVERTVATAGRTVAFSALTIACSVAGLLVMRSPILRTVAGGAVVVSLLAVACAITLVPAVITLLGARLVRPSPLRRVPGVRRALHALGDSSADHGVFSRLAHRVVARPWAVIVVVVAVLGIMAAPIGGLRMRMNPGEYMPAGSSVRTAYDTLQADYPALAAPTVMVVARTDQAGVADLVGQVQDMDHVSHVLVTPVDGHTDMVAVRVLMDVDDPVGARALEAVERIRGIDVGYEHWVGGPAAQLTDFISSMADRAPWAAAIVVCVVLVLLLVMTGSLVVPVKALLINGFSLVASMGATSWLFTHGALGLPQVAGLQTFIVACLAAFGFGLAMDYEVFLLARISEYWEAGCDNDEAVARGLQRSGRIITSAAAIVIAVFLGFVAGQMISIKEVGVGLAVMVAMDATLVRMLLVPATMTVLGRWNWWAPRPVRRVYERLRQEA